MPMKKKSTRMMPRKSTARPRRGLTTAGKGSRVNDVAAVSEVLPFNLVQMNTIYTDYSCTLLQHERAREVAQAYQEYRIKLVEFKFKPLSDTYAPVNNIKVPYLYYLIDKARANNGLQTLDGFKQAGCKPIRFDDRTITVKYKPAVLTDLYDAGVGTGLPVRKLISPWLSTNDNNTVPAGSASFNPSAIDHLGIRWIVDGSLDNPTYEVERVVHIEFRKPLWTELQGTVLPTVDVSTTITILPFHPPQPVVEQPV